MPTFAQHPDHVRHLMAAAIGAADPARLVADHLAVTAAGVHVGGRVVAPERVRLIAVGKAAPAMARAAAAVLGERLTAGVVIGKGDSAETPPRLTYHPGNHPVPGPASVRATRAAVALLADTRPHDLVLCLLSGGASALLTDPLLTLDQWQALTQVLLHSGCTIQELNVIRRQFDRVKGGGLARLAAPATVATLILSDVVGNHLPSIGSGPTVPLPADPVAARAVLARYGVGEKLDGATWAVLTELLDEPPSVAPPPEVWNVIIGDVGLAAEAAAAAARERGFSAEIITTTLTGEARDWGRRAAAVARGLPPDRCLIYGGETTVTVRGDGSGGRNQELALAAADALDGAPGCVVAAFATDGDDGSAPPGAPAVAGAFVTGATLAHAAARGLDAAAYLARNDSYRFFQQAGTGHLLAPTGTNVNDLLLILTYSG